MKTRSSRKKLEASEKQGGKYTKEAESDSASTEDLGVPFFKPRYRRKRKTADQVKILTEEFYANAKWDKEHVRYISKRTGLSDAQVYKWGWDFRKSLKLEHLSDQEGLLETPELLIPSDIDNAIWVIQKEYRNNIFRL